MNWQPQASQQALALRAKVYAQIRSFFKERDVLEVETPALSTCAVTDPQIESIATQRCGYLSTSPEYAMKRLLAFYRQDIFQLCKAFRAEEQGRFHQQEFTILEWYRISWSYQQLMREVEALIRVVFSIQELSKSVFISYRQIFKQYAGIDILEADQADYSKVCANSNITLHSSLTTRCFQEFILDQIILPKLEANQLFFVYEFPREQAALASINENNMAERFECYLNGIELANGFQELTDANEQLARFEDDNRKRAQANQDVMGIDQHFIAALRAGLPESAGVALGVDRLLMLLLEVPHINEVLAFPSG